MHPPVSIELSAVKNPVSAELSAVTKPVSVELSAVAKTVSVELSAVVGWELKKGRKNAVHVSLLGNILLSLHVDKIAIFYYYDETI